MKLQGLKMSEKYVNANREKLRLLYSLDNTVFYVFYNGNRLVQHQKVSLTKYRIYRVVKSKAHKVFIINDNGQLREYHINIFSKVPTDVLPLEYLDQIDCRNEKLNLLFK